MEFHVKINGIEKARVLINADFRTMIIFEFMCIRSFFLSMHFKWLTIICVTVRDGWTLVIGEAFSTQNRLFETCDVFRKSRWSLTAARHRWTFKRERKHQSKLSKTSSSSLGGSTSYFRCQNKLPSYHFWTLLLK